MKMEENEETSVISLRVNSEQKEAIIQFFNFNDWDLNEVNQEDADSNILKKLSLKEHSVFHRMKTAKNVSIVYVDHVSQMKIIDRCGGYQSQLGQTNEIGS